MSLLAQLIDLQELDLATDAARARSRTLPERDSIPLLKSKLEEVDGRLRASQVELSERQAEEEQLGVEVSQIARDIEAAEVERYSGKRMTQDESAAHDESQRALREQKTEIEERELDLLERLEEVEGRIARDQTARTAILAETERAQQVLQKVESDVDAELDRLAKERQNVSPSIPTPILTAYDRVRAQPRAGGRGAALLADGRCGACRIKLPSHETTKMLAEPDDAVIQCPQCRRVLVR